MQGIFCQTLKKKHFKIFRCQPQKKKPQEKHRHDLINGCEQSDYVVCERVLMTKTKLFILKAESVCQTRLSVSFSSLIRQPFSHLKPSSQFLLC